MAQRVTLRQLQNRAATISELTGVDHYVEIGNGIPALVRGNNQAGTPRLYQTHAVYKALTKRELFLGMVGYEEGVRLGMFCAEWGNRGHFIATCGLDHRKAV